MRPPLEAARAELARYIELLEPLEKLSTSGPEKLPPEETVAWERAVSDLAVRRLTSIELEEVVSTFARVLWTSSGWVEPPARIAGALLTCASNWPNDEREEGLDLARRFAERALSIDAQNVGAGLAAARIQLALGNLTEAERQVTSFPSDAAPVIALRSEIAEEQGDRAKAIRLRQQQLEAEAEPARKRMARSEIGRLRQEAGDLTEAIEAFRENLRESPDNGSDRLALALALRDRGLLLEAFSEAESAALVGTPDAAAQLEDLAGRLDRASLTEFRQTLRICRDGDPVALSAPGTHVAPTASGARAKA